jgi:hypothetical protein
MVRGSSLVARISKICRECKQHFLAKQQNTKICNSCRELVQVTCSCGCNKSTTKTVWESNKGPVFIRGHRVKGKTYEQIYGKPRSEIKSGFKKGLENPNYTTQRFNPYGLTRPNSIGENFRSSLEVKFSELLIRNNYSYQYEVRVKIGRDRIKVVDFIINEKIFVEVTGYVTSSWRQDFNTKISLLRAHYPNYPILLLTYKEYVEELRNSCQDIDIFIECIDSEVEVLKKIQLSQSIIFTNSIFSGLEYKKII